MEFLNFCPVPDAKIVKDLNLKWQEYFQQYEDDAKWFERIKQDIEDTRKNIDNRGGRSTRELIWLEKEGTNLVFALEELYIDDYVKSKMARKYRKKPIAEVCKAFLRHIMTFDP